LAPTTAFPWGSVTVPMMLPKTAWPDAVGACNKIAQNRTAKPRTTSRFAIPPLLADPSPVSFKSIPTPTVSPAIVNSNDKLAKRSCTSHFFEYFLRRKAEPKLARIEPGSTAKGTPRTHLKRPRLAPRTKALGLKMLPRFRPRRVPHVGTNAQAGNAAILMRTIRFLARC